jgi:hypothetical protein
LERLGSSRLGLDGTPQGALRRIIRHVDGYAAAQRPKDIEYEVERHRDLPGFDQ